jgi:lipoprotein-anchoring transpeptidase ErfK/SrfK
MGQTRAISLRRGAMRGAAAVAFVAIGVGLAGCGSGSPSASSSAAHHHQTQRSTSASAAKLSAIGAAAANAGKSTQKAAVPPPGTSFVVSLHAAVAGYPAPNQPSNMIVPASWYGYPSVLPVIATEPGWLYVRLAQRPNESTTWIKQSDVTLSTTPYQIVVNLATMHLTVTNLGKQIMDFPAGIGAPDDPTPPGNYFLTMKVPPPSAGYGLFVLATSDHSNTITDWEDSGDAIIGIHGPITSGADAQIGTTGAAISHGCVRLHDNDLALLGGIPAGTPINIVSS